jgi:hypothetical protein
MITRALQLCIAIATTKVLTQELHHKVDREAELDLKMGDLHHLLIEVKKEDLHHQIQEVRMLKLKLEENESVFWANIALLISM